MTTVDPQPQESSCPTPIDVFDRPINHGDTIVYASRRGSSTFLNKLVVQQVFPGLLKGYNPADPTRRTRSITNFSTVAKVF